MGLKLHELHASLIHAPLALLPAATAIDLIAATAGDRSLDKMGRMMWTVGTGGALLAGVAGFAASQEVKADDATVSDAMLIHGWGNTAITLAAVGMTLWRRSKRASVTSALIGVGACCAAIYTAYLGGEMVYAHGVGVRAMPERAKAGVKDSPDVLSKRAPGKFIKDVAGGLGWVMGALAKKASGKEPVRTEALTAGE